MSERQTLIQKANITKMDLHLLFNYENGFLFWINNRKPDIKSGDRAGCISKRADGDRNQIKINGVVYKSARLIFLYHNGYLPEIVDHINRNQLDDRIENLRAANKSQSVRNRNSVKNSSSKYLGVSFYKPTKKWCANIQSNRESKRLGYFISEIDAALAYNNEAIKIHGDFANLNKL